MCEQRIVWGDEWTNYLFTNGRPFLGSVCLFFHAFSFYHHPMDDLLYGNISIHTSMSTRREGNPNTKCNTITEYTSHQTSFFNITQGTRLYLGLYTATSPSTDPFPHCNQHTNRPYARVFSLPQTVATA